LNTEQTVRVEVRQAARNVESGVKRVAAARKNVELQQEKLEAEQKKFENGMSTSFEVLTFQNDLADAELALIRAGLDYVTAQTELERAKGTLLESRGLSLDSE
jgi:outer membrane protein TolC